MALPKAEDGELRGLLRERPAEALARGAAPLLLRAFERRVANVMISERSEAYITVLYALLILRRGHELEPLHEDLERLVAEPSSQREPDWSSEVFGRDLAQLEAWGCVERQAEPLKIRGYKDVRRDRYRYRLTADSVALLEWLELRASAQLEGRASDSRDRLVDVLGALKELSRVVRQWHAGEAKQDAPRRAFHLLGMIDDQVHAIGEELLSFRAAMVTFAARAYDLEALQVILDSLERYVRVYLASIETLRGEIFARLEELSAPRLLRAFTALHETMTRELSATPILFRASGLLRAPSQVLDAQVDFFGDGGQLVTLSARIEDSARGVLKKMHRHLRELERRSARVEDLRSRIAELVELDAETPDERLGQFANALIASAHARFPTRHVPEGTRLVPPLPRRSAASPAERSTRPLTPKRLAPEAARELRVRRLATLAEWLRHDVLQGRELVLLSEARPDDPSAPRRWLDVARVLHLDHQRDLPRLRVDLETLAGSAEVVSGAAHLLAPECRIVDTAGVSQVPEMARRSR